MHCDIDLWSMVVDSWAVNLVHSLPMHVLCSSSHFLPLLFLLLWLGRRIIGMATNCFATPTILILYIMRPTLVCANWVSAYPSHEFFHWKMYDWHSTRVSWVLECLLLYVTNACLLPSQFVWHYHDRLPPNFWESVHTPHMYASPPLMDMYYRWQLHEDCSNLGAHMLRFDGEVELESHDLDQSLLYMVRDDGTGLEGHARHIDINVAPNPFDAIRERLAVVDWDFMDLHL